MARNWQCKSIHFCDINPAKKVIRACRAGGRELLVLCWKNSIEIERQYSKHTLFCCDSNISGTKNASGRIAALCSPSEDNFIVTTEVEVLTTFNTVSASIWVAIGR